MRFVRGPAALFLALSWAAPCWGQVTLPDKVEGPAGHPVYVKAETTAKSVAWVALDPGLELIPAAKLSDKCCTVAFGPAGTYRLLAAVAVNGEPALAITNVVLGGAPPGPGPGPGPGPSAWPKPLTDKPAAGGKYFVTIYADPASAALKAAAGDEATWRKIEALGHAFRIFEASSTQGQAYAAKLTQTPPFLIVLDPAVTNAQNFTVIAPYPATAADLLATVQKAAKRKVLGVGGKRK